MYKKIGWFAILFALAAVIAGAQDGILVQGNWQGEFTGSDWQGRTLRAQVIGESWTEFRAHIFVGAQGVDEVKGIVKGKTEKGVAGFAGEIDLGEKLGGVHSFEGKIAKGVFDGTFKSKSGGKDGAFTMKRVLLKSPTLGQKPPEGAAVLMMDQGENPNQQKELFAKQRELFLKEWNIDPRWDVFGDGSVAMKSSSIFSKQEFGDALYHIEFKTPYMPNERDQGRGNSGVYVAGRYEIQVLDSFAEVPRDNWCGGIYQQAVPLTNPSLPPGEWQTYDITYKAPRFGSDGKKTENARLTVKFNGVVIHDNLELKHPTPGGVAGIEAPTGVLLLQDHGNEVHWKNIWIEPLN